MKAKKEKLAVSAKAARILRKVAAHILEEPRRFEMGWWGLRWKDKHDVALVDDLKRMGYTKPPCGTTACIAGWVHATRVKKPNFIASANFAHRLLGITWGQRTNLFQAGEWPHPYAGQYGDAKTPRQRAEVAARRIEHFIKTGE